MNLLRVFLMGWCNIVLVGLFRRRFGFWVPIGFGLLFTWVGGMGWFRVFLVAWVLSGWAFAYDWFWWLYYWFCYGLLGVTLDWFDSVDLVAEFVGFAWFCCWWFVFGCVW